MAARDFFMYEKAISYKLLIVLCLPANVKTYISWSSNTNLHQCKLTDLESNSNNFHQNNEWKMDHQKFLHFLIFFHAWFASNLQRYQKIKETKPAAKVDNLNALQSKLFILIPLQIVWIQRRLPESNKLKSCLLMQWEKCNKTTYLIETLFSQSILEPHTMSTRLSARWKNSQMENRDTLSLSSSNNQW